MPELPDHLRDKYRMYSIHFENSSMILVHINRPVSFKTVCESFIFQHLELTTDTGQKFETNKIAGVQKIPNQNVPAFELTHDGLLKKVL